jgi:hypothetical protein
MHCPVKVFEPMKSGRINGCTGAKQAPDEADHRRGGGCGSTGFKTAACRLWIVQGKGVLPTGRVEATPFQGTGRVYLSVADGEVDLIPEPCGVPCELSNEPSAASSLLVLLDVIASPAPASAIH